MILFPFIHAIIISEDRILDCQRGIDEVCPSIASVVRFSVSEEQIRHSRERQAIVSPKISTGVLIHPSYLLTRLPKEEIISNTSARVVSHFPSREIVQGTEVFILPVNNPSGQPNEDSLHVLVKLEKPIPGCSAVSLVDSSIERFDPNRINRDFFITHVVSCGMIFRLSHDPCSLRNLGKTPHYARLFISHIDSTGSKPMSLITPRIVYLPKSQSSQKPSFHLHKTSCSLLESSCIFRPDDLTGIPTPYDMGAPVIETGSNHCILGLLPRTSLISAEPITPLDRGEMELVNAFYKVMGAPTLNAFFPCSIELRLPLLNNARLNRAIAAIISGVNTRSTKLSIVSERLAQTLPSSFGFKTQGTPIS